MKLHSLLFRSSLLLFVIALMLAAPRASAQAQNQAQTDASVSQASALQTPAVPARITQAIDETQLVTLKGNVHPLARPEFDQGPVSDATPMNRMLLLLQRSADQEAALQAFMEQQLDRQSPNFHQWLTPQQFGAQYGPADTDIQTVTDWLTAHGFHDIKVSAGHTTIEFSGTVGQVRNAFRTDIHHFLVNGQNRQANVSDPQIPVALSPVVAGIVTLHNFPRKSFRHSAGMFTRTADGRVVPQFTATSGGNTFYIVGPADFAKIYNIPSTLTGSGVTIALVADSNINPQDVNNFRILFGLPGNFTSSNIILNGPDPGPSGPLGDESEADLDVQVSGMVAPQATINLVVSEATLTANGTDLSALYIVDNNIAPVMSMSFGSCEHGLLATGNLLYTSLWEEAAAQGTTVMVSAGDNASAGCDNFNTEAAATSGLAVSGIASTPFNVAVGGTDFDDVGTQTSGGFWSTTNGAGKESALGYIKETTWNDSCAAGATSLNLNTVCATPNNIVGGSGGPSSDACATATINGNTITCTGPHPKPSWQTGTGVPADSVRDIPDVSLYASDGPNSHSFYLTCEADAVSTGSPPSCASTGAFSFGAAGGTSASSPAFAGIMALINQQQGGRQGNVNPFLYKIASISGNSCNSSTQPVTPPSTTCVFYDVTKGNNSVPCVGTSANCSSNNANVAGVLVDPAHTTNPAWMTTTGYDYATGLGTVNVTNLAAAWKTAVMNLKGSSTSLKINGGTAQVNINHGTSITAAVTVSPASGTVAPTGDVALLAPTSVNGSVSDGTLTTSGTTGTVTIGTTFLPGGGPYNVTAHYAGDGTFAPSDSNSVPVMVIKENSSLLAEFVTNTSTNATTFPYGSGPFLRMDILNHTGNSSNCQPLVSGGASTGCAFDATGSVTVTEGGNAILGSPYVVNSEGHAEDQNVQLAAGNHALVATYVGDISYNPSPAVNLNISVTAGATATTVLANPTSGVTTAIPVTLTATIATQSIGNGPTGTVTFSANGTSIGTGNVVPTAATGLSTPTAVAAFGTATLTHTFTTANTYTISATYASGDNNYSASASSGAGNATVTVTSATGGGTFTVSGAAVTVTAGSSGMSNITVTPSGGFTGTVNVTCGTTIPGVTCTPNPLAINIVSASPVASNLTVAVAANSSSLSASAAPLDRKVYAAALAATGGANGWWGLSAGAGLAAIVLLVLPGRRRYRAALALASVCVLSIAMGCGGGYGGNGGPSTTTTHLTVSTTKVAVTGTLTVSATVNSTGSHTPTGSVQFYDGATALGGPVTLTNGSTGQINLTAAQAPAFFQLIGTHAAVSAKYLGDTYNSSSQSGNLSITITGTTNLPITGTSGSTNVNGNVSLTIN